MNSRHAYRAKQNSRGQRSDSKIARRVPDRITVRRLEDLLRQERKSA